LNSAIKFYAWLIIIVCFARIWLIMQYGKCIEPYSATNYQPTLPFVSSSVCSLMQKKSNMCMPYCIMSFRKFHTEKEEAPSIEHPSNRVETYRIQWAYADCGRLNPLWYERRLFFGFKVGQDYRESWIPKNMSSKGIQVNSKNQRMFEVTMKLACLLADPCHAIRLSQWPCQFPSYFWHSLIPRLSLNSLINGIHGESKNVGPGCPSGYDAGLTNQTLLVRFPSPLNFS